MNLKERKQKLEESVVNTLKGMLPKENLEIKAQYDIENGIIATLILQSFPHPELKDALDRIVAYTCNYSEEKDEILVTAFVRKFGYDTFGISAVVNNPVTIDEGFMTGIKAGIKAGIAALDAPELVPEVVAEEDESEEVTA